MRDVPGGKLVRLLQSGISAICLHTNLDAADGGVTTVDGPPSAGA
jgi:putative NIF3 family GTP cyclohydrolase 1 type 2